MAIIAKSPIIKINGVPIDVDSFSWTMLSGPSPHREQFEVSGETSKQLNDLKNPVNLYMELLMYEGGKGTVHKARFDDLYITEVKRQDGYLQTWEIADKRILWEGRKVSRMYNIHWGGYEQKSLAPKADRFFADFVTIQQHRYAKWSLKKVGKIDFLIPGRDDNVTGEIWTAKQIIQDILANVLGIKDYIDELKDNGFQPENLVFDMEPVDSALQQILSLAHANIFINPQGKLVLYSLSIDDSEMLSFLGDFTVFQGSEIPFKQDLHRIRPSKIRVGFEREYEILFKYSETGLSDTRPRTVERGSAPTFDLENVIQIPDSFVIDGKRYQKGSWIPIWKAINLWNNDPKNPPPSGKKLTKKDILRRWLSPNYLEFVYATYALKGNPRHDEIWVNRIAALRQHFRRSFRVLPYWRDRIRQLRADRATLLDPVTGKRQPSPVFMDYTKIATFRRLIKSKNPNAHVAAQIVKGYPKNGDFENARPIPATVSMIDEQLGIFSIDFLQDPAYFVMNFIPGEIDPVPKIAAGITQDLALWGRVSLKEDFRLAVILSAIFAVPNSKKNKLFFDFELKNGNKDIVFDIYSTQDNARFKFGNKMQVIFLQDGSYQISGVKLDNENVIKAIAKAEFEHIKFSWEDRIHTGTFTAVGFKDSYRPKGWIKAVTVQYSNQFGLSTVVSMTEQAIAKPLLTFLGPKVRHILQKSVLSREGI